MIRLSLEDISFMACPLENESTSEHPLAMLNLSTRPHNALVRRGIRTIEQLLSLSEEQVLQVRNIGQGSLAEIRAKLAAWRPGACLTPSAQESLPLPPRAPLWSEGLYKWV